ncbi:MAG TPA: hypothetical protein VG488_12660 [Candidatus Angelobacter sp.]|jgi:hypothetical protein|nr:hypothetical protein [Candidatus Angelobacter sp.]
MASRTTAIAQSLSDQQKRFEISFYHWALKDFHNEVDTGYKMLVKVCDSLVARYIAFTGEILKEDERTLATGLVKRFHPVAALLIGEKITEREDFLINGLLSGQLQGLGLNPRWKKSQLKQMLKETINNVYGEQIRPWSQGETEFTTEIKGWTIRTRLDVGGNSFHFSYDHLIQDRHGKDLSIFPVSCLGWLGIASQTNWDMSETPGQIVEGFTTVCSHFFAAILELLEQI